jgi:hypothetical protein
VGGEFLFALLQLSSCFKVAHAALLAFQRRLASSQAEPLNLDYTLQSAGTSDREKAVVILHGFL